ncbi:MAG: hypothetical protein EBT22_08520, partial [Chloroflexi bacterium]|nr:hypothetical protein [Chloroflexota bacterium]
PDHPGEEASGLMSKYPVLSSLAISPFQAVARLLGAPGPRIAGEGPLARRAPDLVTLGFGPFLGALTVMVTYLMAGSLGYRGAASLLPAMAVATASLVWPYSRTLLNMALPAVLTGAALAVIGYLRGVSAYPTPLIARRFAAGFDQGNSEPIPPTTATPPDVSALRPGFSANSEAHISQEGWRWGGGMAALAGALLGLAGAARYEYLVLALPLWALLAWVVFQRSGLAGGAFLGGLAVVAGSATALPLTLGYNLLRTGHALDFGYGGEGFLSSLLAKPWYGWFGLLFSPGCGVALGGRPGYGRCGCSHGWTCVPVLRKPRDNVVRPDDVGPAVLGGGRTVGVSPHRGDCEADGVGWNGREPIRVAGNRTSVGFELRGKCLGHRGRLQPGMAGPLVTGGDLFGDDMGAVLLGNHGTCATGALVAARWRRQP